MAAPAPVACPVPPRAALRLAAGQPRLALPPSRSRHRPLTSAAAAWCARARGRARGRCGRGRVLLRRRYRCDRHTAGAVTAVAATVACTHRRRCGNNSVFAQRGRTARSQARLGRHARFPARPAQAHACGSVCARHASLAAVRCLAAPHPI
eukprot:1696174-Prymnesium_polylepis.1